MPPNPYLKAIAPGASASSPGGGKKNQKKRDRPSSSAGGAKNESKGKGKASAVDEETLKAEILALGGDEEDLKLLEDVDSESEVEEGGEEEGKGAGKQAGLLSDLKSFMKGLDFSAAGATAPASDDDEDDTAVAGDMSIDVDEALDADEEEEEEVDPTAVKKVDEKKEKKESKHEREERRRAEREEEKEAAKEARDEERFRKEEKKLAKLAPSSAKSPWVVDPTPHWYAVPLPSPSPSASKPSASLLSFLQSRGQTLLDKENQLFSTSLDPKAKHGSAPPPPTGLSKADQVFIQQVLTSGTSSDKISALLLLVSSSPLHNMTYLDQLAALCRKKSRDESGRAVRGVVDWWRGEGGGSPDRKLRYFADQPALATVAQAHEALEKGAQTDLTKDDVDRCLVLFAFEDWFKKWFFQILQALEQMSVDPLAHPRNQAVMHLANLLRDKPEQESNILRLLVNKLGDTQRGIASKTSHHLLQVLQSHPGMTPILVREVSALVLHPRTSIPTSAAAPAASASGAHMRFEDDSEDDKKGKKAASTPTAPPRDHARDNSRYYGVTTLNQVMLKKEQGEVAGKMVDVYFEVFGDVLGRLPDKEESDEEGKEKEEGDKKVAGKKRGRDEGKKGGKGGKKGKGAAKEEEQDAVNDVDAKLVAAVLTGINRAFPFAKIDDEAFKRRLDTLFRITHTSTFNVSIQALLLIFRVSSSKKEFSDRFYRALYASLHDHRLTHSSKQALYLNLIFRATKADKDADRVAAFVKRLLQILFGMETTFVLGALFVVSELLATTPGLRELLSVPEKERQPVADIKPDGAEASTSYDGRKREPRFAHALNSCLWELTPLLNHYHPTVVQYATSVMHGEPLTGASDLEQYSLVHFLDRFVYREAKKASSSKGSSMMQSGLAGQDKSGRVTIVKGGAATEVAVNSDSFKRQNVHDVPADQVFFHKYFTSKSTLSSSKSDAATKRKSKKRGADSDDEDASESEASIADAADDIGKSAFDEEELAEAMEGVESDEDEDEEDFEIQEVEGEQPETDSETEAAIWSAMKNSMPHEEGDSDAEAALDVEASDEDIDLDDDEDLAAYDYSDDEDDEVMKKIRAELAEAKAEERKGKKGKAAAEQDDANSDLGVDEDMDDLLELGGDGVSDDQAEDEAAFAGIEDDEDVLGEDDEEEPFTSAFPDEDEQGSASDDGFLEEDDDVFGSDDDVPLGEAAEDEVDSEEERREAKKAKKRKLKHLPTFASADDYAHLLGGSDDEEI
ncbi:hypothetical protein JCM11251_007066 [Rhodosporidiobolus azoricus]